MINYLNYDAFNLLYLYIWGLMKNPGKASTYKYINYYLENTFNIQGWYSFMWSCSHHEYSETMIIVYIIMDFEKCWMCGFMSTLNLMLVMTI